MQFLVTMMVMMSVISTSWAADFIQPDPTLAPDQVVAIQLTALKMNNAERVDDGIEQTWIFAHPNNKRLTGPLARFTAMVKGPHYKLLLNHRAHRIDEVARNEVQAVFTVTITAKSGGDYECQWVVEKVADGEQAGAWMTSMVTAPRQLGEAI